MRHQRSQLGIRIGYRAKNKLAYMGLPLGARLEIVRVPDKGKRRPRNELLQSVRPGAYRFDGAIVFSGLPFRAWNRWRLVIMAVRIDGRFVGQVSQCGRSGVLCNDSYLVGADRSEEHTSELQSLMRISY